MFSKPKRKRTNNSKMHYIMPARQNRTKKARQNNKAMTNQTKLHSYPSYNAQYHGLNSIAAQYGLKPFTTNEIYSSSAQYPTVEPNPYMNTGIVPDVMNSIPKNSYVSHQSNMVPDTYISPAMNTDNNVFVPTNNAMNNTMTPKSNENTHDMSILLKYNEFPDDETTNITIYKMPYTPIEFKPIITESPDTYDI